MDEMKQIKEGRGKMEKGGRRKVGGRVERKEKKNKLPRLNNIKQKRIRRPLPNIIRIRGLEFGYPKRVKIIHRIRVSPYVHPPIQSASSQKQKGRKDVPDPPVINTPPPSPLATKSRYLTVASAAAMYSSNYHSFILSLVPQPTCEKNKKKDLRPEIIITPFKPAQTQSVSRSTASKERNKPTV